MTVVFQASDAQSQVLDANEDADAVLLYTPLARCWKVAVRVAWSAAQRAGPRIASLVRAFALPSRPARSAPTVPLPSSTAPAAALEFLYLRWDGLGAWHSFIAVLAGKKEVMRSPRTGRQPARLGIAANMGYGGSL